MAHVLDIIEQFQVPMRLAQVQVIQHQVFCRLGLVVVGLLHGKVNLFIRLVTYLFRAIANTVGLLHSTKPHPARLRYCIWTDQGQQINSPYWAQAPVGE